MNLGRIDMARVALVTGGTSGIGEVVFTTLKNNG